MAAVVRLRRWLLGRRSGRVDLRGIRDSLLKRKIQYIQTYNVHVLWRKIPKC